MDYFIIRYFKDRNLDLSFRSDSAFLNHREAVRSVIDTFMIMLDNDIIESVIYFARMGINVQSDLIPTLNRVLELMHSSELSQLVTRLDSITDGSISSHVRSMLRTYATFVIPSELNGIIIDQANLKCLTLKDPQSEELCKSHIRHGRFVFDRPLNVTTHGDVAYKKDYLDLKCKIDMISKKLEFLANRHRFT